jgi:DNA sulfur modification protein DndC
MSETQIKTDLDALIDKLRAVRRELRDEYLQPHNKPWIIGFSGGKDSTLLAHLVLECLLAVAPDQRERRVYLVSNNTLVESPVFSGVPIR